MLPTPSRCVPPRKENASAAERSVCCHRERSEAISIEVRTTVEIASSPSAPRNENARPLGDAEFAAAMDAIGGFETRPSLAVAVSGGPDSMALTLLADRWARARGGLACGLTVDHKLRPESGEEAALVARWLEARGIAHAILRWRGDKPASRIQETARAARYELLAQWCREHGGLHLLAAHHREDQAETHLIRRRAGSGIDGLAGMSTVRELPGCRLVRPLLGVPRARLAAVLAAEGQPCLSDPSNRNPSFERARLRDTADPADLDAAFDQARACGEQRVRREGVLDGLMAQAVALHPAGFALLDPAALLAAEAGSAERLLARIAATIGGGRYPARRERVIRLRAALASDARRARTLGGCRFVPWRGRLLVIRELAAAAPPITLEPGRSAFWDRRFAVELPPEAPAPVCVGYLGQHPSVRIAGLQHRSKELLAGSAAVGNQLPRLVHPVLPAVWDEQGLLCLPHRGYARAPAAVLPRIALHPANRLSDGGFTVV